MPAVLRLLRRLEKRQERYNPRFRRNQATESPKPKAAIFMLGDAAGA
ncbi:hypothetical protein ISS30_03755 [bacterium]|nr:hypothetical protein [bacterium]